MDDTRPDQPGSNHEAWVRVRVEQVLGPESAEAWLHKPNPYLEGHSPLDLLHSGEGERVKEYITALLSGTYL